MGHASSIVIVVVLMIFVLYRRVRRTVGFQQLRVRRMTTRTVILICVAILVLLPDLKHPLAIVGAGAGVVIGLVLSFYAARTTVFEQRGNDWFYRPNVWIGVALLALFIARLAVRMFRVFSLSNAVPSGAGSSAQVLAAYGSDPWTVTTLLALVVYYVTYTLFLLRKQKSLDVSD